MFMLFARYVHAACALCTCFVGIMFMLCAQYVQAACSLCTCCVRILNVLCAHCLSSWCALNTLCVQIVCALSAHCVRTIYPHIGHCQEAGKCLILSPLPTLSWHQLHARRPATVLLSVGAATGAAIVQSWWSHSCSHGASTGAVMVQPWCRQWFAHIYCTCMVSMNWCRHCDAAISYAWSACTGASTVMQHDMVSRHCIS